MVLPVGGAAATPVPVTLTVLVPVAPLFRMDMVPLRAPGPFGVKTKVNVQVAPAFTTAHDVPVTGNSLGLLLLIGLLPVRWTPT